MSKRFVLLVFYFAFSMAYAQENGLLMVPTGHREVIYQTAVTANEQFGITASYDGMIVWDLATGLEVKKIKRPERIEIPFAIPGSNNFGSVHDGDVRVFDVSNFSETIVAKTSLYFICESLVVDQQGQNLYLGGVQYDANNYRAIIYKVGLKNGQTQVVSQIRAADMGVSNPDHNTGIRYGNLSLSPDGTKLMAKYTCYKCVGNAFFQVFNTSSFSEEKRFTEAYAGFASNNLIYTGIARNVEKDKYLFKIVFKQFPALTQVKAMEKEFVWAPYFQFANNSLKLDKAGSTLIVGNRFGLTEIDLNSFEVKSWPDTTDGYQSSTPALGMQSYRLFKQNGGSAMDWVDFKKGDIKRIGGNKPFAPERVTASPNKAVISLYSHAARTVQLIDLQKGEPRVYNYFTDYATPVSWSPVSSQGVLYKNPYGNGEFLLFNAEKPALAPTIIKTSEPFGQTNQGCVWSGNGNRFVIGPGYGVYVWDAKTMTQITKLPGNEQYIGGVSGINQDGSLVAVNFLRKALTADKAARFLAVYNVANGQKLWEIPSPIAQDFYHLVFLNNKVACIGETDTYFYNQNTGVQTNLASHPRTSYNSSLSFDKRFVFTQSATGIVKYEIETGQVAISVSATNNQGGMAHEFLNGFSVGFNADNSLHFFDLKGQRDAGRLYTFVGSNEYAFVNGGNLFEGTDLATKSMYFLKENRILPLQALFEKFYTPQLLQQVLARSEPGIPVIPFNSIKAPPVTRISYTEVNRNLQVEEDLGNVVKSGLVRINVAANCPGDAVAEIRLYHNGKQVSQDNRNLTVADNTEAAKQFEIELQPGENEFKAISLNSQRTESVPVNLLLVYSLPSVKTSAATKPTVAKRAVTLYVVTIGINQYKNARYNLNYAVADAQSFADQVKKSCGNLFQICKPYFITNAEATKEKITQSLEAVAADAQPQDVLIFYYAGHGVLNEAAQKEFFLVPHDVTQLYGNDDGLASKGLASKELQLFSNRIKAQKQLFILDACQSAGALQAMAMRGAAEEKAIAQLARSTGTHWLTASGSDQFAGEFEKLGHGAFTYVLLNGLAGEAALQDGQITVNSLKAYIEAKVPEVTEKYKGTAQYPASYGFGNDFPVFMKQP